MATLARPGSAAAQGEGDCELISSRDFVRIEATGGGIIYISEPSVRCSGGLTIRADSAVTFESSNFSRFIGNVRFREGEQLLTSDRANYFSVDGRLVAWGDARIENLEDSTFITGDSMRFFRANERRPENRLEVTGGRPHAVLYLAQGPDSAAAPDSGGVPDPGAAPDSAALPDPDAPDPVPDTVPAPAPAGDTVAAEDTVPPPPPSPFDLYARMIILEGERGLVALGDVEVLRDSLEAYADSLSYDQDEGRLALRRRARILSRAYSLSGDEVDLLIPGSRIEEIQARVEASLKGSDVDLMAPQVRMYLREDRLERLVAVDWALPGDTLAGEDEPEEPAGEEGAEPPEDLFPVRPVALAQEFRLEADSVEVQAPGEILRSLLAAGSARGESTSRDSLNTPDTPDLIRTDWLEGDTILAEFVEAAEGPDESGRRSYALDRLTATGNARSLYRLDPEEAEGDSLVADAGLPSSDSTGVPRDSVAPAPSERVTFQGPDSIPVVSAPEAAPRPLPLHFVAGDRIIIIMKGGEVERLQVEGSTRGLYLEPIRERRAARSPDPARAGASP